MPGKINRNRGNPIGKNGRQLVCLQCGDWRHLHFDCPHTRPVQQQSQHYSNNSNSTAISTILKRMEEQEKLIKILLQQQKPRSKQSHTNNIQEQASPTDSHDHIDATYNETDINDGDFLN